MKFTMLGIVVCTAVAVGLWQMVSVPDQASPSVSTPSRPHLVAHDSSGHGNDGLNQGHPSLGLPGHRGTSYSFDRAGSWIEVPSADDLNPGRKNFTISAWARFSTMPEPHNDYDIVRKGLSSTSEYKIEVMHGGAVRCIAKDTAGHLARVTGWGRPLTPGRWHRLGCSRSGDAWLVRVDGWSTSKKVRLGAVTNTMPLSIGSNYGLEDEPKGEIDDVRLRDGGDTVGLWHLDEAPSDEAPSDEGDTGSR